MNLQRLMSAMRIALAITFCVPLLACSINVASGTSGTIMPGQSYNETRGVDVTVVATRNINVWAMRLDGLNTGSASATAGARIYDSNCAVIASGGVTISGGRNLSVTIPISGILAVGQSYRLAVYGILGSGDLFLPSSFPYTEPSGKLRINSAHAFPADTCPTNPNLGVPQITAFVSP